MSTATRTNGRTPSKNDLARWVKEGLTQQQMADRQTTRTGMRVSRSAIAMALDRYGLASSSPRPRYENELPWHIKGEHVKHYDARMLRLLGRRNSGVKLSDRDQGLLAAWMRDLDDAQAVVAYVPGHPDGFVWVYRTKEDGDGYIRRP